MYFLYLDGNPGQVKIKVIPRELTLMGFLDRHYGGLKGLEAECRPVFVDRIPEKYPEVCVIKGSIVVPKAITSVVEWVL